MVYCSKCGKPKGVCACPTEKKVENKATKPKNTKSKTPENTEEKDE